jgi:soluble lytic murein transglycosylase-like protein
VGSSATLDALKKPSATLVNRQAVSSQLSAISRQPEGSGQQSAGAIHDFGSLSLGHEATQSCPVATPRTCPFGGACHTCPTRVQAKLIVGQPDDEYEREADRVAEQVMAMKEPPQRSAISSQLPTISRAPSGGAGIEVSPKVEAQIQSLRASGGRPLSASERAFFGPRFGRVFGDVRIHDGSEAAAAARAVNARAFTSGEDIVLGAERGDHSGDRERTLVAHELAHVISNGPAQGLQVVRRAADFNPKAGLMKGGGCSAAGCTAAPAGVACVITDSKAVVRTPDGSAVVEGGKPKVIPKGTSVILLESACAGSNELVSAFSANGSPLGWTRIANVGFCAVTRWNSHTAEAAKKYGIDRATLEAIMYVESRGDRCAGSGCAYGLMQITKSTWVDALKRLVPVKPVDEPEQYLRGHSAFESNWRDPRTNILLGAAILADKLKSVKKITGGTIGAELEAKLAIVAYNAGSDTVNQAIKAAEAAGEKDPVAACLKEEYLKQAIKLTGIYSYYLTGKGASKNKSLSQDEAVQLKYKEVSSYPGKVSGYVQLSKLVQGAVPGTLSKSEPSGVSQSKPKRCGPDVTQWLVNQMCVNKNHPVIKTMREVTWPRYVPFFNIGWTSAALIDFANLVKAGGPWDFKSRQGRTTTGEWRAAKDRACPTPGCDRTVTMCGKCLNYDVPGNIHYGYIGRAASLRSWLLHSAAGLVQPGRWTDDPKDAVAVKIGEELWDEGAEMCTKLQSDYASLNLDRTGGCTPCE